MLRLAIYVLIMCVWVFSFIYDYLYIPVLPHGGAYLLKFRFLTYLNFLCHTVYSILCVVRTVVDERSEIKGVGPHKAHPAAPSYYPSSKLHKFCDFTYATMSFPIGNLVVFLFWSLYYIDRALVYPEYLDNVIPGWLNNVIHVAPTPFIIVDSLLVCHRYPTMREGMTTVSAFAILYEIIVTINYLITGNWIYGILSVLSIPGKILFYIFAIVAINAFYIAGDLFNRLIWGTACHPPKVDESPSTDDKREKVY